MKKLTAETKELMEALVEVSDKGYDQSDLLVAMLVTYEANNPELFMQARAYLELKRAGPEKIF